MNPSLAGHDVVIDNNYISEVQRKSVARLSLYSLRVELQRRNLGTTGLRADLENRVIQDLNRNLAQVSRTASSSSRAGVQRIRRRRRNFATMITVPVRFPEESHPFAGNQPDSKSSLRTRSPKRKVESEGSTVKSSNPRVSYPEVRVTGMLRGRAVWITGQADMEAFWEAAGPCGKASLSRSAPSFNKKSALSASAMKGRAMRQLLALEEGENASAVTLERGGNEHLQLTLLEAFYSAFVSKHLIIKDDTGFALKDAQATWTLFCTRLDRFAPKFVAYCRYRSSGWLPRSGIKYGVDWVLYPSTASKKHTHSPFCVILRFDEGEKAAQIDQSWVRFQNRLRLVKNVAKTVVVANVYAEDASDLTMSYAAAFRAVKVCEMTIDRWLP